MNGNYEEVWSAIPAKALHPVREPMIEALLRIDEPLSARDLVDVLDGLVSMWEAAHYLDALKTLDVVELDRPRLASKRGPFDVRYRLKTREGR